MGRGLSRSGRPVSMSPVQQSVAGELVVCLVLRKSSVVCAGLRCRNRDMDDSACLGEPAHRQAVALAMAEQRSGLERKAVRWRRATIRKHDETDNWHRDVITYRGARIPSAASR